MYSTEVIHRVHESLQALDSSALVLLGGSYLYDEAREESDVDFYFICSIWQIFFLQRIKRAIKELKKNFPEVNFNVMIVPHWLKHHGYYLYGKDIVDKIHTWAVPKPVLVRNCLKLAFYNYLRSQVELVAKEHTIAKAKKQLTVAYMTDAGQIDFNEPFFSQQYINSHAVILSETKNLSCYSPEIRNPDARISDQMGDDKLAERLQEAANKFLHYFCFSWSNYLLYNIRFLLRGNPLFLFTNPDKLILERLIRGLGESSQYPELYKKIKKIIFPVIIY